MNKLIFFLVVVFCLISNNVFAEGPLTKGDADQMLKAHNKLRESLGAGNLKWSPKLAEYADEWANYLKKNKGGKMEHRPQSGKYKRIYGENLFWASALVWSNGKREKQKVSPEKVLGSWAAEQKDYDPKTGKCINGKVCGHFTQVVWNKTTEVGCAMAVNNDQSQVWVCNYNPAGNYVGQKAYDP